MMTFTEIPLVQTIGWTLLHATWQGILIALVLRLLLFLIPNRAAVLRYGLSVGAIFLMLLWAAVTCWQHLPEEGPLLSAEITLLAIDVIPDSNEVLYSSEGISAESSAFSLADVSNHLQPFLPYLVGIWLLGVMFWSLRFMGSMIYLYRLPRRHVWQPEAAWQRKLSALKRQLAISQQVRLLISSKIQEPLAMGFIRPVILIPASLLSNLPPEQIEAILLHELAHVRRADYLVNLLLSMVEILFFYHPAYWWIYRQLKQEREHCCDDQVLKRSGDQITYAQALIAVQKLSTTHQNHLVMNFSGNKSQFTNRVQRLFGQATPQRTAPGISGIGILTFCLMLFVFTSFQQDLHAQNTPQKVQTDIAASHDEEPSPIEAYNIFAQQGEPYKLSVTAEKINLVIDLITAKNSDIAQLQQELKELGVDFKLEKSIPEPDWYFMEISYKDKHSKSEFQNAGLLNLEMIRNPEKGKSSIGFSIGPIPKHLLKPGQKGVAMRFPDFPKKEKDLSFDTETVTEFIPKAENAFNHADEELHPHSVGEDEGIVVEDIHPVGEKVEDIPRKECKDLQFENKQKVILEFEEIRFISLDDKGNEKDNTFIMGPSMELVGESPEKELEVLLIKKDGKCFISWEAFQLFIATTPPEDIEAWTLITDEVAEKRYGKKKTVIIIELKKELTSDTKKNKNTWMDKVPAGEDNARFAKGKTFSDNSFISDWTIFPNPSQGKLHFDFEVKQAGEVDIHILNLNGQIIDKVFSGYIEATRQLFTYEEEDNKLANGIYLLQVKMDGAVVTKKFVIEK